MLYYTVTNERILIVQKDFWYGDDSCRPAGQTQEGTSFPQLLAQLLCRSCVIVLYVCAGYVLRCTDSFCYAAQAFVAFRTAPYFYPYFGMDILVVAHAFDFSNKPRGSLIKCMEITIKDELRDPAGTHLFLNTTSRPPELADNEVISEPPLLHHLFRI